jgi:hypothetical protein
MANPEILKAREIVMAIGRELERIQQYVSAWGAVMREQDRLRAINAELLAACNWAYDVFEVMIAEGIVEYVDLEKLAAPIRKAKGEDQ